jgi:hypothetical protein
MGTIARMIKDLLSLAMHHPSVTALATGSVGAVVLGRGQPGLSQGNNSSFRGPRSAGLPIMFYFVNGRQTQQRGGCKLPPIVAAEHSCKL